MFNFLRLLLAGVLEGSRIGYIYGEPLLLSRSVREHYDDYYYLDPETGFITYRDKIVYEADQQVIYLGRGSSGNDIHLNLYRFKLPFYINGWKDNADLDIILNGDGKEIVDEEVSNDALWPFVINYFNGD